MHRVLTSFCFVLAVIGLLASSTSVTMAQANVRVLRLATTVPSHDPSVVTVKEAVNKILAERTGGRIRIDVYPDGQLGTNATSIQGVETGTVDFDIPGSSFLSGLVPQIQAFELPFVFRSPEEAYAAIAAGPAGQTVNKMIAAKGTMQNLAWWELGVRDFVNDKHPVNTPADLRGIKMRTLPSPTQIAIWRTLGAEPIPMDPNEIYSALSQGTIDGLENILSIVYDSKYYELLKYVSLTNHVITTTPVLASVRTMQSLSPQDRQAVQYAFQQATASQWKMVNEQFVTSVANLRKAGLQINEHPDVAAFKAQVKPVYDTYRSKYGSEVLDQILASDSRWESTNH